MVGVDQLREYMRRQAQEDRNRHSIPVTGKTLEEALQQASIELGIPVRKIEYEILRKGSRGFLGMARQNWSLIAYETVTEEAVEEGLSKRISRPSGTKTILSRMPTARLS